MALYTQSNRKESLRLDAQITNNLNRLDSEAVTKTNNILNQAANNTIKITIENSSHLLPEEGPFMV